MGFEKFGFFFLLLSVQLHPLLALPQTSQRNPLLTIDFKQEQNVTYKSVPKRQSMSATLGDTQNITAVDKRGGGAGGHGGGHGRGGGGRGGAQGRGNGGGKTTPYMQGGVVVPLYAAGGTNHPRLSHTRGSNGGTLNYVSLHYLVSAFFASFFLFAL